MKFLSKNITKILRNLITEYSNNVHNLHSGLPFLPKRLIIKEVVKIKVIFR